jgi:hypothetical protein
LIIVVAIAGVLAAPASAAAPSLAVTPRVIQYGTGEIVLSGVVSSKRAGETVAILSQPCRFTELSEIGRVQSRAGGEFRYRVQPMLNTIFRVQSSNGVSSRVKVGVRPVIRLTRAAAGRYRVQVSTTNPVFLNGKQVVLQRLAGNRWVAVKRARLVKASPETAITVISAVTIPARVRGTLRVVLPVAQAGCYLGATSNTLRA